MCRKQRKVLALVGASGSGKSGRWLKRSGTLGGQHFRRTPNSDLISLKLSFRQTCLLSSLTLLEGAHPRAFLFTALRNISGFTERLRRTTVYCFPPVVETTENGTGSFPVARRSRLVRSTVISLLLRFYDPDQGPDLHELHTSSRSFS